MQIDRPDYIKQLVDSKDNGLIKIVTGLRRVGKSFLLKTLFKKHLLNEGVKKDHILIIDLEDLKMIVGERMKVRRDDFGIVMTGIYEFLLDPNIMDA